MYVPCMADVCMHECMMQLCIHIFTDVRTEQWTDKAVPRVGLETWFHLNEWLNECNTILRPQKTGNKTVIHNLPGICICICIFRWWYEEQGDKGTAALVELRPAGHWTFLSNNGFLCFHSASP